MTVFGGFWHGGVTQILAEGGGQKQPKWPKNPQVLATGHPAKTDRCDRPTCYAPNPQKTPRASLDDPVFVVSILIYGGTPATPKSPKTPKMPPPPPPPPNGPPDTPGRPWARIQPSRKLSQTQTNEAWDPGGFLGLLVGCLGGKPSGTQIEYAQHQKKPI